MVSTPTTAIISQLAPPGTYVGLLSWWPKLRASHPQNSRQASSSTLLDHIHQVRITNPMFHSPFSPSSHPSSAPLPSHPTRQKESRTGRHVATRTSLILPALRNTSILLQEVSMRKIRCGEKKKKNQNVNQQLPSNKSVSLSPTFFVSPSFGFYLNRALHRPITSPWHTSSALNSEPSRVR